VALSCGQQERQRIAKRIDHSMDFGAQPAFAALDRLVFAGFFWAPALCWCARTKLFEETIEINFGPTVVS
jgi:hypothetical protein